MSNKEKNRKWWKDYDVYWWACLV